MRCSRYCVLQISCAAPVTLLRLRRLLSSNRITVLALSVMRADSLALSLLLISAAVQPRALAFVLSSDQASYVIDLDHGCSVSGAWAQGDPSKTNLINTADLGRYVQVLHLRYPAFPERHVASTRQATTQDLRHMTAAPGAASLGPGVRKAPASCVCSLTFSWHRSDICGRLQGQSSSRFEQ
jgi:hypothetical protein